MAVAPSPFRVVGQRIGRVEGPDKVTGRAPYTADILLPGALWGKVLRSPVPYARITSINAERARALPGVQAVITGQDIPHVLVGRNMRDVPVLCWDVVRYVGDRVAAVAADDKDLAEEALSLIEVEYEELEPLLDPLEAIQPGAPPLHPDIQSYHGLPQNLPPDVPNIHCYMEKKRGDLAAGFAEADVIVESEYSSAMMHQGYIEPHACAVQIGEDGRVHVWTSNKNWYTIVAHLAAALGLPKEQIVVEFTRVGGEFGGKGAVMDVPIAYHLARAAGRPVKIVMTYNEEFLAGNPRHSSVVKLKTGVKRDGTIVAHQATTVFDSGAYGGFKPVAGNVLGGGLKTGGCYRIPNVELKAYIAYTNHIPGGFMRAPGDPQGTFAAESHFDTVARKLGMDPLEFRRKNVIVEGDAAPSGEVWKDLKAADVLEAAGEAAGWSAQSGTAGRRPPTAAAGEETTRRHGDTSSPLPLGEGQGEGVPGTPAVGGRPSAVRGKGIALINRHIGGGESKTGVELFADGTLRLTSGVQDAGQGCHTIMAQVAAEVLTIPFEQIQVRLGSTDVAPPDPGIGAARHTHIAGQSAYQGAEEVARRIKAALAQEMGWPEDEITLEDGQFRYNGAPPVAFNDAARVAVTANGGPIEFVSTYTAPNRAEQECFIAQVAEVEVEPDTGAYKVLRIITAEDTGTVINPLGAEGQVEGGVVQGFGFAVMEELRVEEGRVLNPHFGEYKMPCIADIPESKLVFLDATGPGPYNAKALAEHSLIPTAAAIGNAIYDAVGVRVTSTPITAEKVYRGLREQ
jgi:CO/xanthine dehydrogenase Mo-binding subunit